MCGYVQNRSKANLWESPDTVSTACVYDSHPPTLISKLHFQPFFSVLSAPVPTLPAQIAALPSVLPPAQQRRHGDEAGAAPAAGDAQQQAVAEHYDRVTEQAQQEEEAERSALRRFNNWVKAVLIGETVVGGLDVLDLCCGRCAPSACAMRDRVSR